jgi:hypothetical protein
MAAVALDVAQVVQDISRRRSDAEQADGRQRVSDRLQVAELPGEHQGRQDEAVLDPLLGAREPQHFRQSDIKGEFHSALSLILAINAAGDHLCGLGAHRDGHEYRGPGARRSRPKTCATSAA